MHTAHGTIPRHGARAHGSTIGSNLSIFSKGLLLIAIPLLLQLALLFVLRTMESSALEAERLAVHSKEVITKADDLHRMVVQQMASLRAAIIAGDANYQDPTSSAPGQIAGRLAEISALVRDNPPQGRRLARVRDLTGRLDAWIAEQRALLRDGRQREAMTRIAQGEGRERLADVQQEMTAFLGEEDRIDAQRMRSLRRANQRGLVVTTLAALLSLPLAGGLVYVFTHGISARLSIVTTNAARLASSEPLTSPPIVGTDEIAQLDRVVHETSARLAQAAAAKQRARAELEERAAELARVNHELAQQTLENEMFIYSVSHDLRSPLVNLQGFSRELVRACDDLRQALRGTPVPEPTRARTAELVDHDIPESVHFIQTAVSRAAAIIDALLRLSRIGRIEYRREPVAVDTVVATVLDAMRGTITERGAEIVRQKLDDAWGDRTAIEQIFGNLIGNAVNYLDPQRPGRIEIGMGDVPSEAREVPGRWRTYVVRDNGLGIPAAALPRIFIAFQRLHPQAAPGEGIGLSLVRRIVDRHGGRIQVESTQGVGTTISITLPGDATAAASVFPVIPPEET
jgi:signal transduction histidine kinase